MTDKHEDTITLQNDSELINLEPKILENRRTRLTEDNGWKLIRKENGLTVEEKYFDNQGIPMIRSTVYVKTQDENTMKSIIEFIYSSKFKERNEVYLEMRSHNILRNINDTIHIAQSCYNMPAGLPCREFLTARYFKNMGNGTYMMGVQSIDDKNIPIPSIFGNYMVRGTSNCGAMVCPTNNGYMVRTIDHILPNGYLPNWVVNMFKTKVGDKLVRLVEYKCGNDAIIR